VEFPLIHEKGDDFGTGSLIDLFHIGNCKWDINCFYFKGDSIYNIDSGGKDVIHEIGNFLWKIH